MRIGIIQTRGIGDIIIAAPIAAFLLDQGHEVFWPIDSDFIDPFSYALPGIQFLPVDKSITGNSTADFFIELPRRLLSQLQCDRIHVLYSHLTGYDFGQNLLSEAISFDSYKYAVTGIPLAEKWRLKIQRNILRESELFKQLDLHPGEDYVVCHEQGSVYGHDFTQDCEQFESGMRRVHIHSLTSNFFDWVGVLEHCRAFFTVNSLYSNLVDQLKLPCRKYMKVQTTARWTPVLASGWHYL